MPRLRVTRKKLFWTGIVVLAAGLLAPLLVTFNFWHDGIAAALSRGLGRKARIGSVHPKLFGGIGFEIDNVVLEEDPRFGVEPFARIETLRATIGLSSIWNNRIKFSNLVFVNPSLNVVRNATGDWAGHWNVESLGKASAEQAPASASSQKPLGNGESTPKIQIDSGRINFKTGDRKEVYLIEDLDMEILPATAITEPWHLKFVGTPKRTDFGLSPGSRFRGEATFGPFAPAMQSETGTLAHVDLEAENAFIEDITRVFTGVDQGVHGSLNLNLHLAGTTSLLRISGTADVRDLHRWDRLPPLGGKALHADIAAILDLERESFELRSASIPVAKGSVVLDGQVEQLFHHPQAVMGARLRAVPLSDVVEITKQFTARLDPRVTAQGTLSGTVRMDGSPQSLIGALTVEGGRFELKETGQTARLSNFDILFDGATGRAGPLSIGIGDGSKLASMVAWNIPKREFKTHFEADDLPLMPFLKWAKALGSPWGQANFSKGALDLRVNVASVAGQRSITGTAQITNGTLESGAVTQPINIKTARMQFQPGKIIVKPFSATLGTLDLDGNMVAKLPAPTGDLDTVAYLPAIEFDCHASAIDLADLDQMLSPHNRPQPFFHFESKASPSSNFFARFVASGKLDTPSFSYRGSAIRSFKATLSYRNHILEVKNFTGEFAGGTQNGTATVRFAPGPPDFSVESRFSNVDVNEFTSKTASWRGFFSGNLNGNLHVAGSGWNLAEIADHLSGSGEASGTGLELHGMDLVRGETKASLGTRIGSLTSKFQIAKKEVWLQEVKITPVASTSSSQGAARRARTEQKSTLIVSGTVGFDRSLDLTVSEMGGREKAGAPKSRWGGTLESPAPGISDASLRPRSLRPRYER